MKNRSQLKILLLQIRDDQAVRKEEHQSFARFSELSLNQIEILNVFDTPSFSFSIADKYDAVYVGGASEASVLEPEKYPFVPQLISFLEYLIEIKKPVFASCFGFQLGVLALDGTITHHPKDFEMGTYQISLTDKAKDDVLLKHIPNNFWAISVHQEKASEVPLTCDLLGYTKDSTHIFKVKNAPFWAFQFHPEVDKDVLISRLRIYQEKYTDNGDHLEEVINSVVDTPESNRLPKIFIDEVLLV